MNNAEKNKDPYGFKQFMAQRGLAASAYVNGDAAPVGQLVTQHDPATFFGPMGGHVEGAKNVWATHEHGAGQFQAGGENKLEILHMGASDGIAYWVGLQHATVHMGKNPKSTPMSLRVTEVFRYEGDEWKLIHRHADMLAAEPAAQSKPKEQQ